jgi:hypothetical protein
VPKETEVVKETKKAEETEAPKETKKAEEPKVKRVIATKTGEIFADQVVAAAMLFYYTEEFKGCDILRTVDVEELNKADLLFDVGYHYNP